MFIDIVLGGTQLMLLWLKLKGGYGGSWWLVLMPTIVWCVGGFIASIARNREQKDD